MSPDNTEPQTEERIETVLTALLHAEPAPGMELRITAALLRQAGAAAQAKPRWMWLPQIAGVAVVVAAALLVSARVYRQTAVAPAAGRAAEEKAARFSPLNTHPTQGGLQPRPAFIGAKALAQTQRVTGLKAAAFSGNAKVTPAGRSGPQTREAARRAEQAKAEQGFPAPPLPLTEQERLLVRLVHRDDPVQLAQLAPAAREVELQRDREQVSEFFKPPPMPAANFKLEPYPTITGGTQ